MVLGRKPGEYIMIGENIMVKVVKSLSGNLRLAIEAPMEMQVVRGEVWEKNNLNTSSCNIPNIKNIKNIKNIL